ncbi:hypothetical protein [Tepidibacter hydrothermalis]|uniref:YqzL-like protein n=1 Tax=Tepidibacter hydrothermalis TaxID=3036126 RepID=A0ABY8EF95_9FIRM|nr:hypothetical protein [Tepidibacter hydrothermalis]WFD11613.1 hypothetical protein P4S50_05935 [Tepidibacter hydrothermalis]
MNKSIWEYFKKTGDINAYMYVKSYDSLKCKSNTVREIENNYVHKYRWDSTEID